MMNELIDRRLLGFLLYDWLQADQLAARPRYAEHSRDSFEAMLGAANALALKAFAPVNRKADLHEPAFDGERVILIPEIKQALDAFVAGGFSGMAADAELGGLQLPQVIEKACFAHFTCASIALAGYPFLSSGNANLIAAHGSAVQVDAFARPQIAGRFYGTMCLSEPQAGSSLSDIATRAVFEGESVFGPRYRLTGSKMWISGGEHELGENIIHLVLAKIPNDDGSLPAGTKGISIFIVPRVLVNADGALTERNDIALAGLNHKLGYRGTVNALLNFGEGKFKPEGRAGAIGYRIGAPGQGLAIMFHMMNEARIGVGLGAAMLGYAGYRYALQYARERPQGRPVGPSGKDPKQPQVPIIRHADVKRMLLAQKAYAEGALALNLYCAWLVDEQKTAADPGERERAQQLLDILTPIAKSWPSQWCLEANSLAIQVLGGYGYTREYPVEQHWRDNRLNMIHEGTHGIQALDLLGRKVVQDNGALFKRLWVEVQATVGRALQSPNASTRQLVPALANAGHLLSEVAQALFKHGEPEAALAHATHYLQAFGHTVIAWLWLDLLVQAERCDTPVRAGIDAAARYFFSHELPHVAAWLAPAQAADRTILQTDESSL
jgi:alkylation response protein AidB-like acyl-CoA dehydrogenase